MTTLQPERDQHGRFEPGNGGGPGRPPRAVERAYLAALADACPPDTWAAIVGKAVADALDGDGPARLWLSGYLRGKPQAIAPTLNGLAVSERAGVDELELEARERQSVLALRRLMAGAL